LESEEGKPMRNWGNLLDNSNGDNQEDKVRFVISKRRIEQIKPMWLDTQYLVGILMKETNWKGGGIS
jgi:hypothetical protein